MTCPTIILGTCFAPAGCHCHVEALQPKSCREVPALYPLTLSLLFLPCSPALISGALAERVNFGSFCLFVGIWHIIVYCPICKCVWGDGARIGRFGVNDFAGGLVVHMSSGKWRCKLVTVVAWTRVSMA